MSGFWQLALVTVFLFYSAAYLVAVSWLAERATRGQATRLPRPVLPALLVLGALPVVGSLLAWLN